MSWERLDELTDAHRAKNAVQMLQFMTASQGDEKSWKDQQKRLAAEIKREK